MQTNVIMPDNLKPMYLQIHMQDVSQGHFKRSLTGFNSAFNLSLTSCQAKVKKFCVPYSLPITGERIVGCIPFTIVLALREMPTASYRIWTLVTVLFSKDDNDNTHVTSLITLTNIF